MDLTSIDPVVGAAIVQMGTSLSTLALKGTASAIHSKIEALRSERNIEKVRTAYDEMINQVLEEREKAVRLAQSYKQELEKVVISDEDIEYLQQTINAVIDVIKSFQPADGTTVKASIDAADSLKGLLTKDVLKTMQLLGFNFRAAIGEPLTDLCARAIRSLGEKNRNQHNRK